MDQGNFRKQLIYTARFPPVVVKLKAVMNIEILQGKFRVENLTSSRSFSNDIHASTTSQAPESFGVLCCIPLVKSFKHLVSV